MSDYIIVDNVVELPAVSGIEDFYPKPWASWITVMYEDLINKNYHLLNNLKGYEHIETWEMSDLYGQR